MSSFIHLHSWDTMVLWMITAQMMTAIMMTIANVIVSADTDRKVTELSSILTNTGSASM